MAAVKHALIHIGAAATEKTSAEFRAGIKLVLESAAGDAVKIAAIEALKSQYSVEHVTVQNCNLSG